MSALSNWSGNRLLLHLRASNLKRLMPELEQISCRRGQVLMDADSPLDHVFSVPRHPPSGFWSRSQELRSGYRARRSHGRWR